MRAAIIGYGRFGRALAGLLTDAGHPHRAYDPATADGELGEVLAGAEVVVVAVPVPATRAALLALRPHLRATQLVLDVGSVKLGPEAALQAVLGDGLPWAATHPLFGPASLARGERPLRVVVCPNRRQPQASLQARRFWERIGCEVLELDAEAHDRAMADSHVLAFFVAKALMDLGVEAHPFAPPSFQAMARTIEAVRADAGHLFPAIQNENEFAAPARRRLIDALENLHEQLAHSPPGGAGEGFAIPDLGARGPDLRETRELIDEVDRELVALLAQRAQLSLRAKRAKQAAAPPLADGSGGVPVVRDPERERALLEARRRWAEEAGLDGEEVRELFEAILRHSRRIQRQEER